MLYYLNRIEWLLRLYKERKVLLAFSLAVVVNLIILALFTGGSGECSSVPQQQDEELPVRPQPQAPARKKSPGRASLPAKPAKARPPFTGPADEERTGTISLEVCPPGLESGVIQEVEVKVNSGDVAHSIVLDLAGSLSGTLAEADGKAVAGARISIQSVEEGLSQVSATDGQGRFDFRNLPAGTYQLTAEAPGLEALSREVSLPSEPLRLVIPR